MSNLFRYKGTGKERLIQQQLRKNQKKKKKTLDHHRVNTNKSTRAGGYSNIISFQNYLNEDVHAKLKNHMVKWLVSSPGRIEFEG